MYNTKIPTATEHRAPRRRRGRARRGRAAAEAPYNYYL